eukprot:4136123-Amphidinium_carterae.1
MEPRPEKNRKGLSAQIVLLLDCLKAQRKNDRPPIPYRPKENKKFQEHRHTPKILESRTKQCLPVGSFLKGFQNSCGAHYFVAWKRYWCALFRSLEA